MIQKYIQRDALAQMNVLDYRLVVYKNGEWDCEFTINKKQLKAIEKFISDSWEDGNVNNI